MEENLPNPTELPKTPESIIEADLPPRIIDKYKRFILPTIILILILLISGISFKLVYSWKKKSPSTPSVSPESGFSLEDIKAGLSPTPEIEITPTQKPTLIPTKKLLTPSPTTKPKATFTPTPTSMPTPTPTPTPTPRVPNPPIIDISYPTEMQTIEFSSPSQTFCVVDNPAGGNTEGVQRKHSLNDGAWSSYSDIFTLCFEPKEGLNRVQLQYKNKYGDESTMYTRQFTFHRI